MLSKFLDPKNDVAFKKIFGSEKNKDILIHFLNDILGFSGSQALQSVEFLSPVQDPEIVAKKQSIVDVLCQDAEGVKYIIEMQVAQTTGFEKRAQYYAAKAYSQQMDKGGEYQDLKEIIFIAIADCVLFPDKVSYKSDHIVLDRETYAHDLKDFSFTFIELPKFHKRETSQLETLLEKWCYFFKYAPETKAVDLEEIIGSDHIIKRAYEALDQFYWSENELALYDQECKRVWDEAAILDYAINKGRKEGLEKGLEKGRAEGRAEGREEGKRVVVQRLLKAGLPVEQIAEMTGFSLEVLRQLEQYELSEIV